MYKTKDKVMYTGNSNSWVTTGKTYIVIKVHNNIPDMYAVYNNICHRWWLRASEMRLIAHKNLVGGELL